MAESHWIDYGIIAIFVLSAFAGLVRGVIREILSIIVWIAAFVVALTCAEKVAEAFTHHPTVQSATSSLGVDATAHSVSYFALGVSFIALFILVLILGSLIAYIIASIVESTGVGFINRLLGALFGLARGFLIVLILVFLVQLTPLQGQPWWQQSQYIPSFQPAVNWLTEMAQPTLDQLKAKVGTFKGASQQQIIHDMKQSYQEQTAP